MRNADKVELRGLMDKAVVDVLDAHSIALGIDRSSMAEDWITQRAVLEVRKAMLLQRLMQGNPRIAELAGVKSEQSGE